VDFYCSTLHDAFFRISYDDVFPSTYAALWWPTSLLPRFAALTLVVLLLVVLLVLVLVLVLVLLLRLLHPPCSARGQCW
jgi:hypothetical protein